MAAIAACAPKEGVRPDGLNPPSQVSSLTLIGQYSIPPLTRYPPSFGPYFGGISGLTAGLLPDEVFGITDAHLGGRLYRFAIRGLPDAMKVATLQLIPLQRSPEDQEPDPEALVRQSDGSFIVASEGTGREPRRPPTIVQFGPWGEFIRRLPIPERYVPEERGPLTRGARGNAGFESLALSRHGDHLFAATETALVQDGDSANFDAGARARIVRYERHDHAFGPRAEFAYEIDRLEAPAFKPGIFINGLVELLALDTDTLLALERGYIEDSARPGSGVNRIRIYRVSLDDASDISQVDSMRGRTDIVAVKKTLLLDLGTVAGLSADLSPALDNFEGMAFGPRLPDGRRTLLIVSDDNFNTSQRTWFLAFAIQ